MGWDRVGESECSVARSLAVVGDRWTFLLIRNLFDGARRFDQLQCNMHVSPHLLSMRLKRLEDDGVVERIPYQERPRRYEYRLTEKGQDLYPVLVKLGEWGAKWCGCDTAGFTEEPEPAQPEPASIPEPVEGR
jgi:DNA-binding HxlR family transcriptional regulator